MCELHGPVHVVMDLYTDTYTAASAVAVLLLNGVKDYIQLCAVDVSHTLGRVNELLGVHMHQLLATHKL